MPDDDVGAVAPCIQEEAVPRLLLHFVATTVAGHRRVMVRTSDSDVVVIGVSTFVALGQQIGELWIAFGMHQRYRFIPLHDIVRELGPSRALALPACHVLTGYNTTLALFGKDKKTAWLVWQPLPELTLHLELLSSHNQALKMIRFHKNVLERFVTQLYGVYEEEITTVDATRLYIFKHKLSDFELMPPSSDALHQHFLRVTYLSGHVWGNALNKSPDPVSPTNWRW